MNVSKANLAVLIPFYGSIDSLREALLSLSEQSPIHDVIVVDDGNAIPVEIPAAHPRAIVIRQEKNQGITTALNLGLDYIRRVGYLYTARLDAGDRSLPGRLEKQVQLLERESECMMVGGGATCVTKEGRRLFTVKPPEKADKILRALHRQCCIIHPTVMFRTAVFEQVRGYREKYPAAEDYDLFFRIASLFPVTNISEVLVDYKPSGPASISGKQRHKQVLSRLRIVAAHFNPALHESYLGLLEAITCLILPRAAFVCIHTLKAALARARTLG